MEEEQQRRVKQVRKDMIKIRTHKGTGERKMTLNLLRAVAHLPQEKAARQLNVGNTRFKAATRQLGMASWPYRKIKSIRNLKNVIEQNPELLGDAADLEQLQLFEEFVFQNPDMPLDDHFRSLRQAAYKITHKSKKTAQAGPISRL